MTLPTIESAIPSAKPTFRRTTVPTTVPSKYLLPTSINYYIYNGKYYSTLANVNLNNPSNFCQSGYYYYYLPTDWVFAPDDIDSRTAIYLNTWSTNTVVVASGVGYYSKSYFGAKNTAYINWLSYSYSYSYGYSYKCAQCNCEILIMYSPYPKTLKPSYSPITLYNPSSSKSSSSSSSRNSGLYSLVGLPFFLAFCCFISIYKYRHRAQAMQFQRIQVQPSIQPGVVVNSAGYYEQPPVDNSTYPIMVQAQPIPYGNSSNMQQQSYSQTQPGYTQLPPQQVNYGGYAQTQPQLQYGYAQPQQPQQQPQPQGYSYGNSQIHPQPQPQDPQLTSGDHYYSKPQLYNPNTAVFPYDGHAHALPTNDDGDHHPSYTEGSSYPKI
eukprot:gene35088-45417_t